MSPAPRRPRRSCALVAAGVLAALALPVTASAAAGATSRTATASVSASGTAPAPVSRSWTRRSTVDPAAAEVLRLVNVERAKVSCPAVRWEPRLATAARLHSQDMAAKSYFSHTSLDGRSPWDRIRAQGYTEGSGENIAAGQRTPAAVMTSWMNSSGHRANILSCSNRALGVGIGYGGPYGIYWTQNFGRS